MFSLDLKSVAVCQNYLKVCPLSRVYLGNNIFMGEFWVLMTQVSEDAALVGEQAAMIQWYAPSLSNVIARKARPNFWLYQKLGKFTKGWKGSAWSHLIHMKPSCSHCPAFKIIFGLVPNGGLIANIFCLGNPFKAKAILSSGVRNYLKFYTSISGVVQAHTLKRTIR